jgi:hypothetical protein
MSRAADPVPGPAGRVSGAARPAPRAAQIRRTPPLSPWAKARLSWGIVVTYVRVRRLLRTKGLPTTVRTLRERDSGPAGLDELESWERGHRIASAVTRTLKVLPADGRCLNRSLVLLAMLAERGIDTTLVIGTSSRPSFEAHAWIEHLGYPLLPDGGSTYGRLIEI